ncbi:MAG: hypothetical protein HPY50_16805 [Firmicutes bacterium]|nr:hypothetical protein [Bacillota bacterium]
MSVKEELSKSAEEYLKHILYPELNPKVAMRRILWEMEREGKPYFKDGGIL